MWVILAVSDSDKHFDTAIKEYEKRMGGKLKVESVKPSRNGTHEQIIQKDTDQILSLLQKKYPDYSKILLSKDGKSMSTEQFADLLKKNLNVVFVVWWPYGLDEVKLQKHINTKIAFWQMTLQHGLAKLVLLEQLYRVSMIWEGRQYHY